MKIDTAIEDVQRAEADLAKRLRTTGERHAAEHDLYHLGHTLARKCAEHLDRLAPLAETYGTKARDARAETPGLVETARRTTAELMGRTEATSGLLLRDLRATYLAAQEAEICWIILMQAAKAGRDSRLLEVVTGCHSETEVTGKWLRTRIKETSPQALVTG